MALETQPSGIVQFGTFEADLQSGELRKQGKRIKVQELPFRVLTVLLQHPGEIVTREELRSQNWPPDTFVDFDNGLNTAINKLRDALGDSAESPRFIETVPRRGYRFIGPVVSHQRVKAPVRVEQSKAAENQPARKSQTRRWLVPAVVTMLTLLALSYIALRSRARDIAHSKINSLAVLPLKNLSGDSAQEYLADGMTEELIGCLAGIHDLRVVSRTSVMRFKKDVQSSMPEIARTLNVDAVVEGSVIWEGTRIRVHAQLIRGATDEHFWSETYDREFRDALGLQSEVAESIALKVRATITGKERSRLTAARSVSPEVYESYLKGLYALRKKASTKAEIEESIGYFQDAITKDLTFAPAHVGLAEAYTFLTTVTIGGSPAERLKAISSARQALELDPDLAEAHVVLAHMLQNQWHWAEAEAEYRRGLELSPSNAGAYAGLADWLLSQGRLDEAVDRAKRARELDPSPGAGRVLGWILFHARRYDEAIREYRSALAIEPDNANTLWRLGFALGFKYQSQEAIAALERAVSLPDRALSSII